MREPKYYNSNGMSPLEAYRNGLLSKEEYIGFCKGNVIKYIVRCDKKGNFCKDLKKAKHYIDEMIENGE